MKDLITIETASIGKSVYPDLVITVNGLRTRMLYEELDNDELRRLGAYPKLDTSMLSTQNYIYEILNYLMRLSIEAQHSRIRKSEDLIYKKIQNLLYKGDVTAEDIAQEVLRLQEIIKDADVDY